MKDRTADRERYRRLTRWLGRYRAALRRQELLAQELAGLRADAEHLGSALRGTPGAAGPDTARLPRAVERLVAAEEALQSQIAACLQCRAEVVSAVGLVAHPQQQEVLRRRYLLGQTYAEIADAMGLVERRIYQLHRAALAGLPLPDAQAEDTAQNVQTDFSNNTL